jgi:uncharacterized protein
MNTTSPRVQPVAESERLHHLDVLRGVALFGILLVNFEYFGRPITALVLGPDAALTGVSQWVDGLIAVFAEGKFYALFSLLFGAGFTLLMHRAEASHRPFRSLYLRRLAVLLAFGFGHAVLLWPGDILFVYALIALLMLLLFSRTPTSRLPKWAMVFLLLPPAVNWLFAGLLGLAAFDPGAARQIAAGFEQQDATVRASIAEAAGAYASGSYVEVVGQRLADFAMLLSWAPFWIPPVLGFFLLGRWLIASGRLLDPTVHAGFFLAASRLGVGLGLPLSALGYWLMLDQPLHTPSSLLAEASTVLAGGAALLAFGYLGLVIRHARALHWLAPAGRMALSNYLLQSLFWTTLFYGYGFGLWGQLSRAAQLPLAILFFAGQLLLSHWWLARFRFGPAEWLWRSLTYLRPQPMRRQTIAITGDSASDEARARGTAEQQ